MSYQAVVRDASNKLVVNHQVGMQISIVQSSEDGTTIYTETQTPTTNANGLVSIRIGDGAGFASIDWANGPYFIKTEIDPAGGTSYTITGVSQLLSVPYALYAEKSGSAGPQGDKGDKGDQGPRGIQGYDGANGLTTSVNGVTQINGAITLTKSNIGLGNVDNTSDANKPISSDTQAALNLKVDKEAGKGLSTEDYTTAEKTKLAGIASQAEVNVQADWDETDNTLDSYIENKPTLFTTSDETDPLYAASPAAVITNAGSGVVISTDERTKLTGIAVGAEVNVNADWNAISGDSKILNKPTLFTNSDETDPIYTASQAASITNAGSGMVISNAERTKLTGIAVGAEVNVNADWNAVSGDAQILNKPALFSTSDETDPVYTASQAASITDAGSGVVISNAERTKLAGIATGAEVNVQADWNQATTTADDFIKNKPTLFTTSDETDPVYSTDPAASITDAGSGEVITSSERTKLNGIEAQAEVNVQADWNQATTTADDFIKNKPTIPAAADGSETIVKAGTNITVIGSGTTGSPYIINAVASMTQVQRDALTPVEGLMVYNNTTHQPNYYNGTEWMNYDGTSAKTLAIGVGHQGGKIAYIFQYDDPGYVAGEIHGIIAALSRLANTKKWFNGSYIVTGASSENIGDAEFNTTKIVQAQGDGDYAAKSCYDYSVTENGVVYNDWWLPTRNECSKIRASRLYGDGVWSSTEVDDQNAYASNLNINTFTVDLQQWKISTYSVLPIRYF
ncbi:MAG: collagen-like protein [Prolixibacteraceae bacterium]|nr:collagen-like protein [Prolixibacteraceae bacterium]